MNKPYAIVSDVHCHSWSQFSKINSLGVNSRLQVILEELVRAATTLLAAGGDTMRVAGDLFHVRGKIEPSVFNPTFDTFAQIAAMGVKIEIIPGNHDLEGHSASRLGNAMQQLEQIAGVTVVTEPTSFCGTNDDWAIMLPWIDSLDELRSIAKKLADPSTDLIIHAPLNGVLTGLPDMGLDPVECAAWGYRRVFCGHYHNHKEFCGGKVFSVGATSHQTWSDPNTLAGFLIVHPDRVEHYESAASKFINIDDVADITPAVSGNYVRLRLKDADEKALIAARKDLEAVGAAGWVDHSSKKRTSARPVSTAAGNMTLEVSVANFVLNHMPPSALDRRRIATEALAVLTQARTVGNE